VPVVGAVSAIGGALQLALPHRPLDRVDGQTGRADQERKRGPDDDQGVAPTVAAQSFDESDH